MMGVCGRVWVCSDPKNTPLGNTELHFTNEPLVRCSGCVPRLSLEPCGSHDTRIQGRALSHAPLHLRRDRLLYGDTELRSARGRSWLQRVSRKNRAPRFG